MKFILTNTKDPDDPERCLKRYPKIKDICKNVTTVSEGYSRVLLVEIDSLETLVAFVSQIREIILYTLVKEVSGIKVDGSIEIYDDYRE